MSTNYYVSWPGGVEADGALWRNETKLHIGKTGGGHVSLQAYDERTWSDFPVGWEPIVSWSDWLRTLRDHPGYVIYDEYQRIMGLDQLVVRITNTPPEDRSTQYNWVLRNPGYVTLDDYWLDGDGFSMCRRDFF